MLPEEMVELSASEAFSSAIPIRRCRKCLLMFPATEDCFYVSKARLLWTCKRCVRAQARARYAANAVEERAKAKDRYQRWALENPAQHAQQVNDASARSRARAERAKVDPELAERLREYCRSYRERRKRDPRRHRAALENRRIRDTIKRREAGIAAVPQRSRLGVVAATERSAILPVGPLRAYLATRLELSGMTLDEFAGQVGLNPRALSRVLRESELVRLDLADRVMTNLPRTLYDLYPHLRDAA